MRDEKVHYLKILLPIIIGSGLLFVPLVGDFHFESAMLVALVGCFWAGVSACRKEKMESDFSRALQITGYLYLVGLPLLINAVVTGCFSIHGLAFWILFPMPSVFFGYAIGRLLRSLGVSLACHLTVGILLTIALGVFLYELLNYPQVYFFNHVWGGWPGPIYDETVQVSGSTLFFRTLTVLWAALLWHIPLIEEDRLSKWIIGFAAIAIGLGYMQLAEWGVITPRSYIKNVLGGHKQTEHFELFYDKRFYTDREIEKLALEHEWYYRQITESLELGQGDAPGKIESYLYRHPWQKKKLVGAKFTSYVPIWLEQDQLHIAKQQIRNSLRHELVHVLSKQFGNNLFNGSWSVGLIEGVAVAIDGGSSFTSTPDQIVVSEKPYPTAAELRQAFSARGFYGGRSGVNYITSGSFVQFLMDNYPVELLKKAYRTGNIVTTYQEDWQSLTSRWHQQLDSVRVDSVDQRTARQIFSIPSLFEQQCPHVVSDFASSWDTYQFHLANHDTARALVYLDRAIAKGDSLPFVKSEWSFRHLTQNHPRKVQRAASLQDTTIDLQLLYADAFAMTGDLKRARTFLKRAQKLFARKPDSRLEAALSTRMDEQQWRIYRKMTYHNILPDSAIFSKVYYRTKIRSMRKAMKQERPKLVLAYARQLLYMPFHERYFDDYQRLIHYLGYAGYNDLAGNMISQLSQLSLREKYRQRLEQERQWLKFLASF